MNNTTLVMYSTKYKFLVLILDSPSSSAHKKHKKHKKKHKRKKELEASESISSEVTPKPAIKLKLKIGGETLGTKKYINLDGHEILLGCTILCINL